MWGEILKANRHFLQSVSTLKVTELQDLAQGHSVQAHSHPHPNSTRTSWGKKKERKQASTTGQGRGKAGSLDLPSLLLLTKSVSHTKLKTYYRTLCQFSMDLVTQ